MTGSKGVVAAVGHRLGPAGGRPRPAVRPPVSAAELAILRYVATGLPIEAVALRLDTSPRTVRRRMRNLCDRIGATCTIQAVVWAAHRGLV